MTIRDYINIIEAACQCDHPPEAELDEVAPPGDKAETWIRHRKKEFKARYGKRWKQVLYAKAWKLFRD